MQWAVLRVTDERDHPIPRPKIGRDGGVIRYIVAWTTPNVIAPTAGASAHRGQENVP